MTQYELQPGQVNVVSDILEMLDTITERMHNAANDTELLRNLGIIGTAAALASAVLVKNRSVTPVSRSILKQLSAGIEKAKRMGRMTSGVTKVVRNI